MLLLVKNEEKYFEFIRKTRIHPENISGFIKQEKITKEQQQKYMKIYSNNYFIALLNDTPAGWVGIKNNDIRICTNPTHKEQGVGKFMLRKIIEINPNATAKVLKQNISSQKLFSTCGFTIYKIDKKFHYYKFD